MHSELIKTIPKNIHPLKMKSFNKDTLESFHNETLYNVDPSNHIEKVDISYKNTRTNKIILNKLTENLRSQQRMGSFLDQLFLTTSNLSSLNIYKSINVKLLPGESLNRIKLLLDFKEKSKFFASLSGPIIFLL